MEATPVECDPVPAGCRRDVPRPPAACLSGLTAALGTAGPGQGGGGATPGSRVARSGPPGAPAEVHGPVTPGLPPIPLPGRLARVQTRGAGPGRAFSDEELTELALAADPDAPLAGDAVPIDVHLAQCGTELRAPGGALPLWYMPPVVRSGGRRWKAPVVLAVVAAFLLIDALGLCNTYGILSLA
jgi:hypothetical protein